MFHFTNMQIDRLRKSKGYESFPFLTLYGEGPYEGPSADWHLNPECVNGDALVKESNFLDSRLARYCDGCKESDDWDKVDWIDYDGANVAAILNGLNSIDAQLEALAMRGSLNLGVSGRIATTLFLDLPADFEMVERCENFNPTAEVLKEAVKVAAETFTTYLRSEVGREMFAYLEFEYPSGYKWNSEFNALMFSKEHMEDTYLALATAYGVEVAPEVFVATGPEFILLHLSKKAYNAPLLLDDSVSPDVLHTAGILWEPGGSTILADGGKAFQAAKDLV